MKPEGELGRATIADAGVCKDTPGGEEGGVEAEKESETK